MKAIDSCGEQDDLAVGLSPRKVSSGNQSGQEHFYIPAQLYSGLVGKKNLIFFQGVSLPPLPLPQAFM